MSLRSSFPTCVFRLGILLTSVVLGISAVAQESFLVSTQEGKVSSYDLATNTFLDSAKLSGASFNLVPSPNPRLAFVSIRSSYYSVLDLTLNREMARIQGVKASSGTFTPDGSLFVAPDFSLSLDIVDPSGLKLVRKVNFKAVQPLQTSPGQIVATNKRAYVFPRNKQSTPKIAVIDLSTFAVSAISLPGGNVCRKCGGITPDGSTLAVVEAENSDSKVHVLLISTATNKIILDKVQDAFVNAQGLVVTPDGNDSSKIYGYVVGRTNRQVLAVLDLVANSPTYGMILPATEAEVDLSIQEMAINSDGSRLVLVGVGNSQFDHNVETYDTAKLFSDPGSARAGTLNVGPGVQVSAVCINSFSTTIPNTAPVVTSVSGNITNDAQHDIQIMGGNFQPGALVRIGSMDPLPANVNGSGTLTVTVPAKAPAGKALDIIVTNPGTNKPPDQQNQSGLLSGQFNILLDPAFQPKTQFATVNLDYSFSVYDPIQRTVVNNQAANKGDSFYYPAFNVDGKELYISQQKSSWSSEEGCCELLPVKTSDDSIEAPVPLPPSSQSISSSEGMDARLDPSTGKPVVDMMWLSDDLYVGMIDTNPDSPTFHSVIRVFSAGIADSFPFGHVMTVTPDGKFAYLWYDSTPPPDYQFTSSLGIMDLTTGAFTSFSRAALGVYNTQLQISVSPDGKSLLLMSYKGNQARIKVFDISNPTHPKALAELTPVPVPGHGSPYVANYQVVGNQLYGIDSNGIIVVFNFNRTTGDFRQRGYYVVDTATPLYAFAFSADGSNLYLGDDFNDRVLVLATDKLATGKGAEVTALRAPYGPLALGVSPVPRAADFLKKPRSMQRMPSPTSKGLP